MANYFATATPIKGGGGFSVSITGPNGYSGTAHSSTNEHLISATKAAISADTGEEVSAIGLTLDYAMKADDD